MADIEIILSPPSFQAVIDGPRRASLSIVLNSGREKLRQSISLTSSKPLPTIFEESRSLRYHLHTLLLFTFSDLKNIVLPQTILGLITALYCCQPTSLPSPTTPTTTSSILARLPLSIAWVWLNLLSFTVSNQTQPASLLEDLTNKPWRPLPANRITHPEARAVFYVSSALALLLSFYTGGVAEGAALIFLTALYNDFGLADTGIVTRALINAVGYTIFGLGAAAVLTHNLPQAVSAQGYLWLAFLTLVVLTTGNISDLQDQEGDRANNRRTVPLVLGDETARHMLAGLMVVLTIGALRFWGTKFAGSVVVFGIAGLVIKRLLVGDKEGYKSTFKLWTCWLVTLYLLPAMGRS